MATRKTKTRTTTTKAKAKATPTTKAKAKTTAAQPGADVLNAMLAAAGAENPEPKPPLRGTAVDIVLDCSGSMGRLVPKVRDLVLAQLRALAAQSMEDATFAVAVHKFGRVFYPSDYDSTQGFRFARGIVLDQYDATDWSTNLRDAMIRVLSEGGGALSTFERGRTIEWSRLVFVLTDGEENVYARTVGEVQASVRVADSVGNMTLVMLVPPGAAAHTARETGVPMGNIREWEQTERGVVELQGSVTRGLDSFLPARAKGVRSTSTYFVDVSQLGTADVKAQADDVTAHFVRVPIKGECTIREAFEQAGLQFGKGLGYYELSKPEKVQPTKDVLVQRRGAKTIHGGPRVRPMIGLPTGQAIRIAPKNLGEWRVFIRSDSDKRMLVRGTDLLVFAG